MSHLSEEALADYADRERNRTGLPLTDWETLSAQLRREGIIRDAGARALVNQHWLRAAAAVLLVAGGAAAGRYTANGSTRQPNAVSDQGAAAQKPVTQPMVAEYESQASQASQNSATPFKSEDEAWQVLNRAGEEYQRASAYLASRDATGTVDSTAVYQARLAALDGMTSASRKALYDAPHDPVINQYYLAAQGAREATLRQLSTSLPTGVKLVKW